MVNHFKVEALDRLRFVFFVFWEKKKITNYRQFYFFSKYILLKTPQREEKYILFPMQTQCESCHIEREKQRHTTESQRGDRRRSGRQEAA